MLSKTDIVRELSFRGLGGQNQIKHILDGLAELAAEQVAQGEDFTVPGIVRVSYTYRAPRRKGEAYKKGDTYVGFGGVEQVAEQDSAARKALVRLVARPAGEVARLKPSARPEAQSAFLKSKTGRAVVRRKAK